MKQLKTREQYLSEESRCPNTVCNSSNIQAGEIIADGNQAWREVSCHECGTAWRDVYNLTTYEPIN